MLSLYGWLEHILSKNVENNSIKVAGATVDITKFFNFIQNSNLKIFITKIIRNPVSKYSNRR